jgi:hypothetical protein
MFVSYFFRNCLLFGEFLLVYSVKSTSSHSQQRLLRGEVLSFTPKNAKVRHFSYRFEISQSGIMEVNVKKGISPS